ncbi:hypothetical protein B0J18DRAFT_175586 [Chaetomium sp. MPI-SDFR-AT-0129]|nr:hypothetical protein B0J18DRAFT_175586 [Chaetomium sp. MPI-SDFR-AT-0129]
MDGLGRAGWIWGTCRIFLSLFAARTHTTKEPVLEAFICFVCFLCCFFRYGTRNLFLPLYLFSYLSLSLSLYTKGEMGLLCTESYLNFLSLSLLKGFFLSAPFCSLFNGISCGSA